MMGKPSSSSSSSTQPNKSLIKQQPHLSGAYIRTLVKHLTSVKTKHKQFPESVNSSNAQCFGTDHNNMQESPPPSPPVPPPPAAHKKQVRRRQHTSKPYQERLLNMAEARREIVTALKFHRAAMKQRETSSHPTQPSPDINTATAAASMAADAAAVAAGVSNSYLECYSSLSCSSPPVPCYWSISTTSPSPLPSSIFQENLDHFTLPNQTLGLNLNFQDFQNLDTNLYYNKNPLSNSNYATSSLSASSSSSPCNSSSAAISMAAEEDVVVVGVTTSTATTTTTTSSSSSSGVSLHHAVDDEGMEEIRSLGEQHQIEWNDNLNLMMSARWFKFLKTIESEQEDGKFDDEVNPFDQVLEFPPCMDIGESEGMDGEWLA